MEVDIIEALQLKTQELRVLTVALEERIDLLQSNGSPSKVTREVLESVAEEIRRIRRLLSKL